MYDNEIEDYLKFVETNYKWYLSFLKLYFATSIFQKFSTIHFYINLQTTLLDISGDTRFVSDEPVNYDRRVYVSS